MNIDSTARTFDVVVATPTGSPLVGVLPPPDADHPGVVTVHLVGATATLKVYNASGALPGTFGSDTSPLGGGGL